MNLLTLVVGIVAASVGCVIAVLSFAILRQPRWRNVLTGTVLALFGAAIIWLSLQPNNTWQMGAPVSNKLTGLLLVGFVMSLLVLKGVLDIREGSRTLRDKTSSSLQIAKGRLQIVIAVIVTAWILLISLVAMTQFRK